MDRSGDDDTPTQAAVETLLEHTERTLEYQIDTLSDVDDKAIRVYRANVLFVSVLVGGVSIAARTDGPIRQVVNLNSVTGMALLVGSLAAGALTYRSSDLEAGVSPDLISETAESARDEARTVHAVLDRYGTQIERNDAVLERNARLMTYTTIATVNGIAYVAAGTFVAFAVEPGTPFTYALLLSLAVLPVAVWTSKVLAFPDHSGHRFLAAAVAVLSVPVVATVLQGWVFAGETEHVWLLLALYVLVLGLLARVLDGFRYHSYFVALFALVMASTVAAVSPPGSTHPSLLHWLLSDGLAGLLGAVGAIDLAVFVLVGTVLVVVDYRVYAADIGGDE